MSRKPLHHQTRSSLPSVFDNKAAYQLLRLARQLVCRFHGLSTGQDAKLAISDPSRFDGPAEPPTIAIFRHPVEVLCDTSGQVRELVHEVLIEQVAGLLNISPEIVDPLFRRFRGH
ncbi:metallopeptidase family protein [Arthrobacter polaris]|uniref:metallopeptidase family protein n=1 Tax=Arthrobacter polaris TaxID=2813727 RepID=UPI001F2820F4|nr:metallopeptidase family protein [Arthrobacter polaris]UIK90134.1 metallopeptidase family protein [Arthrobacter polaris]